MRSGRRGGRLQRRSVVAGA